MDKEYGLCDNKFMFDDLFGNDYIRNIDLFCIRSEINANGNIEKIGGMAIINRQLKHIIF